MKVYLESLLKLLWIAKTGFAASNIVEPANDP
jgi:hypothetical protein